MKVPSLYKPTFRREGVFHEIETLAARSLTASKIKEKEKTDKDKEKEKEKDSSDSGTPDAGLPFAGSSSASTSTSVSAPTIPGYKKISSLALDPEDAITLRGRIIKFKYLSGSGDDADSDNSHNTLKELKNLVERLGLKKASEQELEKALWDLSTLFASPHTSVSSFELLQSGLVDGLLEFATESEGDVDRKGVCFRFRLVLPFENDC